MYSTLLILHSWFRWLVLASLGYALFRAYRGYSSGGLFTKTDNSIRHRTATIAHIQLVIGFTLYLKSPVVNAFFVNAGDGVQHLSTAFFGVIHSVLMLISIVVVTIGSALAKRRTADREKFRTMLVWFSVALLLIFIAIPWPFSPLAHRPLLRPIYP